MATATAPAVETTDEVAAADVTIMTDENVGSHLIGATFENWQAAVATLREGGKDGVKQANAVTALLKEANQSPAPGVVIEIELMPSTETEAMLEAIQNAFPDEVEYEFGNYNRKTQTVRAKTSPSKTKASSGKKKGTARECTCGCGEMTAGGLFRPGHDARFKGNMLRAIDEGGPEGEAALEALRAHPNLYPIKEAEARLGSGPTKKAAQAERLAALKAKKEAEAAQVDDEEVDDEDDVDDEDEEGDES